MTVQMEDTEDTDPIPPVLENGADEKDEAQPRSLWLRIVGGMLLAVAVGLIIYGLALSAGTSRVIQKEAPSKPIIPTRLTSVPADESRSFQYFQLPNGLKVVNVRDNRALQMAFAVAVQAGSFSDPENLPGLAHFCEHMLFVPGYSEASSSSSFDNFINDHAGINNAYTSDEVTVYFASLSQDAGAEGLKRFADFFKDFAVTPESMEKEVHAIDSEHAKNVKNPERQVLEVMYKLANPESPISRFHTGSAKTLLEKPKHPPEDTRAALEKFWKEHYCPNHMTLVTVGSEILSTQLDLVKEQFSGLAPKSEECQKPVKKYDDPIAWPEGRLQKWINVQGSDPKTKLWMMFPLPDVSKDYLSQPLEYLDYMLTYAGEGSFSRVVKDTLSLATHYETMYDTTSAGTNLIFVLHLTKVGSLHVGLLLDVLFAYLAKLRLKGVNEDLYASLAMIEKIKWDWWEPDSPAGTADTLAERMTRVDDVTKLLSADALIERPNPGLVKALIERIKPANMNIAFVNPLCDHQDEGCSGVPEDKFFEKNQEVETLANYNVKYSVRPYEDVLPHHAERWDDWLQGTTSQEAIEQYITEQVQPKDEPEEQEPGTKIEVMPGSPLTASPPRPIEDIPKAIPLEHMHANFGNMAHLQDNGGIDSLLFGEWPKSLDVGQLPEGGPRIDKAEVWYRSGWVTTSPKVHLEIMLRPVKKKEKKIEDRKQEPISDVLLELYGRLLGEEMAPKLVDLTVTGVSYEMTVGASGLTFSFVGFMPSMPALISKVLSEFNRFNKDKNLTPDLRFKRTRRHLQEDLRTYKDVPSTYAIQDRNRLLCKGPHARSELLQILDDANHTGVTLEKAVESVTDLLLKRKLRVTALAMGNLDEQKAQDMVTDFLKGIEVPHAEEEIAEDHSDEGDEVERVSPIVNIEKPVEVRKLNPKRADPSDVVVVSFLVGPSSVETRVNLGLISGLLHNVARDELQTNNDRGFVVNFGVVLLSNVQVISATVQGEASNADLMEAAVQHVLIDVMPKRLKELSDQDLQQYKASYRQELIQPPTAATGEFEHFSGPVFAYNAPHDGAKGGGICFDLQNEMLKYLDGPLATKETLIQEWSTRILGTSKEEEGRKRVVIKYFRGDTLPPRPSIEEATKSWQNESIQADMIALLTKEYEKTDVIHEVNSQERYKLVDKGGWFDIDQHCKLQEPHKSEGVPEVPQQIRQLVAKKNEDIFTNRHHKVYVPKVNFSSPWVTDQSQLLQVRSELMPAMRGRKQQQRSLRP